MPANAKSYWALGIVVALLVVDNFSISMICTLALWAMVAGALAVAATGAQDLRLGPVRCRHLLVESRPTRLFGLLAHGLHRG
jgi:hypothetical protein